MKVRQLNEKQIVINDVVFNIKDIMAITTLDNKVKVFLNDGKNVSVESFSSEGDVSTCFNKIAYLISKVPSSIVKVEGERLINASYFNSAEYYSGAKSGMLVLRGLRSMRIQPISPKGAKFIKDVIDFQKTENNLGN